MQSFSPPELPHKSDAVIIGGGVIGTMVAYTLVQAGIRPLLVERHDIASGTTGSAAAAALLQTKTSAKKLAITKQSLTLLDDIHNHLERRFEYAHTGSLLVASNEDELNLVQNMNASLRALGLEVEMLDGDQTRTIMPILSQGVLGGSYSPRDAQINPLELVIACANYARRQGAHFATFTEVTGIETKGQRIVAVKTTAGRVLTDTVINAAGIWAPKIGRMVGLEIPVFPLKGELLVTEPCPPQMVGTLIAAKYLLSKSSLEGNNSNTRSKLKRSVGITLVQLSRGNFIVGSTREQADDTSSSYGGIYELANQLLELVPSLAEVYLLRAFAGVRPVTPDGYPIIGESPHLPGFILACGFGGDGLAMSAIAAETILSLLNDTPDQDLLQTFSIERFEHSEKREVTK
jgi:sarcosine oxidase subunit beta